MRECMRVKLSHAKLNQTCFTQVVDVTLSADKRTCLAFLGWLSAEHDIQPGLGVFAKADLSSNVELYLRALEAKELRYSTLANYCNSLISITSCTPLLHRLRYDLH